MCFAIGHQLRRYFSIGKELLVHEKLESMKKEVDDYYNILLNDLNRLDIELHLQNQMLNLINLNFQLENLRLKKIESSGKINQRMRVLYFQSLTSLLFQGLDFMKKIALTQKLRELILFQIECIRYANGLNKLIVIGDILKILIMLEVLLILNRLKNLEKLVREN